VSQIDRGGAGPSDAGFRRELGLVDTAVVVAGAIIGVGIFANPANVARILGEPSLILLAWVLGGILALLGGFAYAELGSRLPLVGGQYTYLARAYPPVIAFLYGVALLFIINGGSIAAVSIVFASYVDRSFLPLGHWGIRAVAALALLTLTIINLLGVRQGKWTNNVLMAAKIGGMLLLIGLALFASVPAEASRTVTAADPKRSLTGLMFTALVPIMFAYGGWQNAGSIAGEIKDPGRTLARANVIGVGVVVLLYVGLNLAYLHVLPVEQIGASTAVAADMARAVAGETGARFLSALILVSSLGFLAVIIMTAPRLYYAMAQDGLFPRRAATLHPRFRTPAFTLWFQCAVSLVLLMTNTYDQLLSYVVFADWLFFGLTVAAIFVLRRRQPEAAGVARMPGHPVTTLIFVIVAAGIVLNSFVAYPEQSLIGSAILIAAGVAYLFLLHRRPARGVS
jgi:APA family basic amino acid/polyamine antiporter